MYQPDSDNSLLFIERVRTVNGFLFNWTTITFTVDKGYACETNGVKLLTILSLRL